MSERLVVSCHCGAVRFELTLPTKWCAHCHCDDCRRAHGAGFVTWFGVEASRLRLEAGESELVRYQSSAGARRTFCRRCGTTMLFEGDRWPGEVHVALACLEGELDRSPQAHTYWDRSPDWMRDFHQLRRLGGPTGTQPLP
jgi:hypothetical protein